MKKFKKVLAVILSAVMLLTLFPLSVFADPSPAPNSVVQGAKGTGTDGTVTVLLSASGLSAALRSLDDEDAFLDAVKSMVRREGSLLTVEELLEVIPMDDFLDLILGTNRERLDDLLNNLSAGNKRNLLDLIDDLDALIATADTDALAAFAAGVVGIDGVVDTAALRNYLSQLTVSEVKALFGANYGAFIDALAAAIGAETLLANDETPLDFYDLVNVSAIDAADFADELDTHAATLLAALRDMLEANVTIPTAAYTAYPALFSANEALRNALVAKIKDNANSAILTDAGVAAAAKLLPEADLNQLLDDHPEIVAELVSRINEGTIDGDTLLTQEGLTWLNAQFVADPTKTAVTVEDFDFIRGNNTYYYLDVVALEVADAVLDLGVNVNPYLDGITFTSSDINTIFGTAANYNAANLFSAIVEAVNDNDLTLSDYVNVDVSALLADNGVVGFFKAHVTDYFTPSEIVDILGDDLTGYLKADVYSHTSMVSLAKQYVDFAATLQKLLGDGEALGDYVDIDAFLALDVDFGALFDLFSESEIVDQLKDNVREILGALTEEQFGQAVTFLIATVLEQVKKITVEGYAVAEENAGLLELNAEALIAAVWEILPKLEDLADESFDGTLLSFNVTADYENADGTPVHKDINFVVRVESGISAIRRAAALFDRYISVEKNGSLVSVEINTPGVIADLYRALLESGDSETVAALRQKFLSMGGMTGVDMVNAFADIPLSEIVAALDDTDVNELWARLVNEGYVERALEKLNDVAGTQYTLADVDTLDEILDLIREENLPTIETIVSGLSEKLGTDVMAALETVAAVADENEFVQRLLEKAATLPGIGQFVDGVSAVDVLETYKDMDPVKAVVSFISDRIGRDLVSKLYEEQTADELYHRALAFANARLAGIYEKFQSLVVNFSDPTYEPSNRFVRLIRSFIPAGALSAFRSHSLADVYRGNGEFGASVENVSIDLNSVNDRLLGIIRRFVDLGDDAETTIRAFLPSGSIGFDVAVKFTFTGVYKVNYFDENGNELLTAFLPKGTNPEVIDIPEVAGKEVKGWADAPADGNTVSAIAGDANLYASYIEEKYNVTFKLYDGTAALVDLGSVEVVKGTPVSAAQLPAVTPPDNLADGGYSPVWFSGEVLDKANVINVTAENVTADVTYTLAYLPVDLVEDSEAIVYLTTDAAGNWVAQVLDADDFDVVINAESPAFANAQSIAVESDTVSMTISSELLAAIKAGDPALSNLRLSSKRSAAPHEFTVESGIYTATSREVYALDLVKNVSDLNPNGTPVGNFNGGLTVAIAPDPESLTVLASGSQTQRTAVYIVENGVATESLEPVTSTADNSLSFTPSHFTDVVIVNEYLLTAAFEGTVTEGTLKANGTDVGNGILIPEGATVKNLQPSISATAATTNRIDSMSVGTTNVAIGGDFSPMPSAPATVTILTQAIDFEAFYRMPDGTLFAASEKAAANAWLAAHPNSAPAGYTFTRGAGNVFLFENEDVDPNVVQATVYRTPTLTPVKYPIVFRPGHGAADINATFTVLDAENGTFMAPALPEIAGFAAVRWDDFDLSAILAGTSEAVVNGVYVARLYTVTYVNGSTAAFTAGAEINAETGYTATAGFEIEKIVYVTEGGAETVVTGGTFVMPASNVLIVVTERAKTKPVVVNGREMTGTVGGVLTFEIRLSSDEVLAEAPANARLVSFETDSDGDRTLLFAVDVTEDTSTLTYRVEKRDAANNRVTNGIIGGSANSDEGKIIRYSTTPDTTFPSAVYSFAVYENEGRAVSLLWLWILLAILLVIAVITLLYLLIVRKGLGPNVFTRIIVAIVSVFFTMCLGVYALFSGEVFRKKKSK